MNKSPPFIVSLSWIYLNCTLNDDTDYLFIHCESAKAMLLHVSRHGPGFLLYYRYCWLTSKRSLKSMILGKAGLLFRILSQLFYGAFKLLKTVWFSMKNTGYNVTFEILHYLFIKKTLNFHWEKIKEYMGIQKGKTHKWESNYKKESNQEK